VKLSLQGGCFNYKKDGRLGDAFLYAKVADTAGRSITS
jgi:hypothetical protein